MIAQSDRRSSRFRVEPCREPAAHALSDLARAAATCHASLLRWDADASTLTVSSVAGRPLLASGMVLPADDVDAVLLEDDGGVPLTLPVLALLAGASGIEDTFVAPLRAADGALQALVFLGWTDAASAPSDGRLLDAVEQHRPPLEAALRASLTAPIVVAHEDELVAHGIARMVEGGYVSPVLTCVDAAELRRTLDARGASLVLCSDRLTPAVPLRTVVDRVRDRAPGTRVVVLTHRETSARLAAARAANADGLAALDGGATQLLPVLDAVRRGETVLPVAGAAGAEPALSPRELLLLRWLDQRLTYREVAMRLGVPPSSARSQARSLFRKLGVTSRDAAVRQARLDGLLEP